MDETRALRRELRRLEYELGAAVAQVPLLRAMVNGSRDGLALLDEAGRIVEHNEAFGAMFAPSSTDLAQLHLAQVIAPVDEAGPLWPADPAGDGAPRIARPLPVPSEALAPPEAEACAPRSRQMARPESAPTDNSPRAPASDLLELIITPTEDPRLWVASARRLTEATLHARALHEARRRVADLTVELDAQKRYAALFEHSPDALLLVGPSGRLLQHNALAARWWPTLETGHALGSSLPHLAPTLGLYCTFGAPCSTPGSNRTSIEWCDERPEGHVFVQATAVPVVVPDGCGALISARDITAHRQAERALEAALEKASLTLIEREVLLKEVHHRVKNNLQIISSLLSMQADRSPTEAQHALSESTYRIRSMALIHEMLYGGDDLARVDISTYLSQLALELRGALCPTAELTLDMQPLELPIDEAIPIGLLINELLTNAFKHGRSPDGRCRVKVGSGSPNPGRVRIIVSDEGPGLPEKAPRSRPSSLGMTIAAALARQLGATLESSNAPGATFALSFELAPEVAAQRHPN